MLRLARRVAFRPLASARAVGRAPSLTVSPAAGAPVPRSSDEEESWDRTIAAALPAVVAIKVNRVRAFDTASAGTVQATGFVVDAEQGIILTNRHVAGPGPVVAEAIFQNNEEVSLSLAYYDPVHDFAFFRFDPSALRHMKPTELRLAPEQAEVTSEILIIGNNAGEKCSIHRTTLARLDRNAPHYSRSSYNDFNTFYFHSASGTSGGSSGSPVLNKRGSAIALNAGGKSGTSAGFFLPLDRVARALELLRSGAAVPRGTLEMVVTHQTYDEALRLGLPHEAESALRAAGAARGVLAVTEVLPEGPAAAAGVQPGDAALDRAVGGAVAVSLVRGGEAREVEVPVADLHALTPSCYVEVGGAVVNELSYQQARNHGLPARGVYVAHPGYIFRQARLSKGSIILAVNGQPTPTLAAFVATLAGAAHGTPLTVRYSDLGARAHTQLVSVRYDTKWFAPQSGRRPPVGDWQTGTLGQATGWLNAAQPDATATGMRYRGTGVVLDAAAGLVAVDRNTVTSTLGDASLTLGGRVTVAARVEYVHPLHNFALLRYDPACVPADVRVSAAKLAPRPLPPGAEVVIVGLKSGLNEDIDASRRVDFVCRRTRVANSGWIKLPLPNPPRFQVYNAETLGLEVAPPVDGGVLASDDGTVAALWVSCAYQPAPNQLASPISLAAARQLGLDDATLAAHAPAASVLLVTHVHGAEAASQASASVQLGVVRDGAPFAVTAPMLPSDGLGTTRVLGWAGLLLQETPDAVRAQRSVPAQGGVYASYRFYGSPSSRYDLSPTSHIIEVDSVPTPTLAALLECTRGKADGEVVRVKTVDLEGRLRMTTLKLDLKYWPTFTLSRSAAGEWSRTMEAPAEAEQDGLG
ncbi:Pro-apoptotic serine protease [Emiliania huxleyi CCMP1516]|uniref:PDZ-like domain-containing protein n=2 Tax=Emiliania huxleyi TaxID=2903 RepID=A0A0D3IN71_EMIH1|nr:Pro-apoptotic serine protease [Emiliania huxleyi CCMP1516]EOD12706.1 Pro-apoptotic serine protease [Emiliania huxleyi CCMP1516]|eukprot:XP_005765135.1 Pro-apoptotic serine protease [Emiliania huxleyi CCMP1516]